MKRIVAVSILLMGVTVSVAAQRTTEGTYKEGKVEKALVKLDKEWAEAEARGDIATVSRILAKEYTFTDLDGSTGTKETLVHSQAAATKREPQSARDYSVRVYGNTAVLTHNATLRRGNDSIDARAIHIFVNRNERWQVVAHQWTLLNPTEGRPLQKEFLLACVRYSYEPEVRSFYGNSATVLNKLQNDDMGLADRRGYLLLIETKTTAELAFFDRLDEDHFNVSQWYGATLGDFRERVTNTILDNKGIACVGAQTKAMVQAKFNPKDLGAIPTPLNARAAFAHFIKKYGENEYLRVTMLLLC